MSDIEDSCTRACSGIPLVFIIILLMDAVYVRVCPLAKDQVGAIAKWNVTKCFFRW